MVRYPANAVSLDRMALIFPPTGESPHRIGRAEAGCTSDQFYFIDQKNPPPVTGGENEPGYSEPLKAPDPSTLTGLRDTRRSNRLAETLADSNERQSLAGPENYDLIDKLRIVVNLRAAERGRK